MFFFSKIGGSKKKLAHTRGLFKQVFVSVEQERIVKSWLRGPSPPRTVTRPLLRRPDRFESTDSHSMIPSLGGERGCIV